MRCAAAVFAAALLAVGLVTACAGGESPAADATGPVEATDVQASPESLILELIRLREEGRPEDAARYFISNDAYRDWNDTQDLTEVDASILCSSDNVTCDYVYGDYLSGEECSGTTSQQVRENGIVDHEGNSIPEGRLLVNAYVADAAADRGFDTGCGFGMTQIGGSWWIAHG
ncbi:hypothetical protein [Actinomyces gaoshouyii]|uniref:hypothetical protein n=1 Tax=Actinomyces gaoshouyii TaxID=1960083 RepID=UPI000F7A38F6|nr:hypothetical protein [Actinomyces gaoshouyii]